MADNNGPENNEFKKTVRFRFYRGSPSLGRATDDLFQKGWDLEEMESSTLAEMLHVVRSRCNAIEAQLEQLKPKLAEAHRELLYSPGCSALIQSCSCASSQS